ncbi:YihY/virulence factor BrkB family protein [Ralstonia sp. UBA689]|uniref:YihY/virulence factor BrkB family protein n=1 Tax=Ralstonia sp. UBA689 TaxID=1947373 RepID=UPI0025EB0355|nr:YihY/virulence factor BrkB family protein [Ralstonia sp. UBA689]
MRLAAFLIDRDVLKRSARVLIGAGRLWSAHRAASKGAALSFYTLFSMAPVLVLVISIAGLFFGEQAARGEIFGQIQGLVGAQGAAAVETVLAATKRSGHGVFAAVVAVVLLLVGATTAFSELKDSLDELWDVPPRQQAGLWGLLRSRLLSFSLILVLAFLLLVSLIVNAALAVVERFWGAMWSGAGLGLVLVAEALSSVFAFAVVSLLFGTIFKMLPETRVAWRDVALGAVVTALLFTLGKHLIGLYLGNSAVASSYGAAGSVVALMLWIYYSAQIFFFGALVTRQYALLFGSRQDEAAGSGTQAALLNPTLAASLASGASGGARERDR